MIHPASQSQIEAADPGTSTWLSANAGSGKTRVLTNRVALLLLQGTPPERILCLTYTKAAAGEMQNRLFAQLGQWAMASDDDLQRALADMGATAPDADRLAHARTLFARAIETPGGLKIQTIHAFCGGLLRRFPLEAGVSPQFTEMDERRSKLLAADTLETFVSDPEGQRLFDAVATELTDQDAEGLTRAIVGNRVHFANATSRKDIFDQLDADDGFSFDAMIADIFTDAEDICMPLVPLLDPEKRNQVGVWRKLQQINWRAPDRTDIALLEDCLLLGKTAKTPYAAKPNPAINKSIASALGPAVDALIDLSQRLAEWSAQKRAWVTAHRTAVLHAFAHPYLARFDAEKTARGWLDFDDLITRTQALLSRSDVAQWVLFKLDGGIDHILVDEAQDTSPAQWAVISALASEFTSGEGAREDVERTIFVVGDKKQSIYSFQGADPRQFDQQRDRFHADFDAIGAPFQPRDLQYSFRTSPLLLRLVDQVCGDGNAPGTGDSVLHKAFFEDKPGRIEILPAIEPTKEEDEDRQWFDAVDRAAANHHHVELARRIVGRLCSILDSQTPILVKDNRRPVQPGDVTILVRKRGTLFNALIAECKAAGLPFAGADVMNVAQELAVRDLTALLQVLVTPEDDLSLAAVLRSPLFGLSEDALFRLAHDRQEPFLWRELFNQREHHSQTAEILEDLQRLAVDNYVV